MGRLVKGEVVVVPFPFTDRQAAKIRPAVVLAAPLDNEIILCQITKTPRDDGYSIGVSKDDFVSGNLPYASYARVCHLFTANTSVIQRRGMRLNEAKTAEIIEGVIAALRK